jgi:hypothetical protein
MKPLEIELLTRVAAVLHSPALLPEGFHYGGVYYDIAYERADDDTYLRFTAYEGCRIAGVLELREARQEKKSMENGTKVRTNKELEIPQGMIAMASMIANRRPDAVGEITGIVPGHGGEVYWIRHGSDGTTAPYAVNEFETAE